MKRNTSQFALTCLAISLALVARGDSAATWQSCRTDFDSFDVSNCLYRAKTGALSVSPHYLGRLFFGEHDLAVLISNEGLSYVNRAGGVIIPSVANMDNGADPFVHGLVRTLTRGRYGFADLQGRIVVPPIYDGALNEESEPPRVCMGCRTKCDGRYPNCEHHYFAGGEWFKLNNRGEVAKLTPMRQ
jgi:hypothetical protein